jgi:hypothetical protein
MGYILTHVKTHPLWVRFFIVLCAACCDDVLARFDRFWSPYGRENRAPWLLGVSLVDMFSLA